MKLKLERVRVVIGKLLSKSFSKFTFHKTLKNLSLDASEAVAQRCSIKKLLLEISQNSQENTCARVSFLTKLQAWPATLLKKKL